MPAKNQPTIPPTRCYRLLIEAPAPSRRFTTATLLQIEARCACHFPRFSSRMEVCHRHHETGDLLVLGIHATKPLPVAALAIDLLGAANTPSLQIEIGNAVLEVDGTRPPKAIAASLRGICARSRAIAPTRMRPA